jgi:polyprenyl-phospho-N-acetylgalactosaminyl synthase
VVKNLQSSYKRRRAEMLSQRNAQEPFDPPDGWLNDYPPERLSRERLMNPEAIQVVPGTADEAAMADGCNTEGVYVVVPAYNEAGKILLVVDELLTAFKHVVVVNDGSTDDTAAVVRTSTATLISHAINLGQGAALQTGISLALRQGARYVITFDADGQHRVQDALLIASSLKRGDADVILGSRFLGGTVGMPPSRRVVLKTVIAAGNWGRRGARLTDAHNGLRGFNRAAAQRLRITHNGMAHASEITQQIRSSGLRVREVPVTIEYTEYSLRKGQSAMNGINILSDLITGRFLK